MMPINTIANPANSRLVEAYYAQCEAILARALAFEREVTFKETRKMRELAKSINQLLTCVPTTEEKDTFVLIRPKL